MPINTVNANKRLPGNEVETHKTLKWQAPITKYQSADRTTKQKFIQNTTFIFPAAGGRGVKRP